MTIAETLAEPFGPYLDEVLLKSQKEIMLTKQKHFVLESLLLEQAGECIGLDNIEDVELRDQAPVRFRGVLHIQDINWLSDEGRCWLSDDVQARAFYLKLDDCVARHRLCVRIQGTLLAHPAYLTSNKDLRITSIDSTERKNRWYEVKTLDHYCYSLSRVFLSRYRALNAISTVVAFDKTLPIDEQTPKQDRTPAWLVTKYIEHYRRQRGENDQIIHRRHVHRSEVYDMFGMHAEWLKTLVVKKSLLDKNAWQLFCVEARERKNSRRRGVSWVDVEAEWGNGEDDVSRHGDDEGREHKVEEKKVGKKHKVKKTKAASNLADVKNYVSDSASEYIEYDSGDGYTYNLVGHSPPPRPESSHPLADSEAVQAFIPDVDPAVLSEVPPHIFAQPRIPRGFIWFCPDNNCSVKINLLDLNDTDLKHMHPDDREFLKQKHWTLRDKRFRELFFDIVERHYHRHLRNAGLKILGYGTDKVENGWPILEERKIEQPGQLRWDDNARIERIKPSDINTTNQPRD